MHNTTAYPLFAPTSHLLVVALPCPPPCRMAHSIEMQMSLAQLPPTATPRISITKWELSFTSCFCSLVAFVSFFRFFFFISFSFCCCHLLCLALHLLLWFFWRISSKWQVKWQACRLLHATFCLPSHAFPFLISATSLIRFSPAVFSDKPSSLFLPIPICCYENFTKFSLTLALILSATLSVAGRIVLDPKSTTTHTHFGVFCPIFPDIYQA